MILFAILEIFFQQFMPFKSIYFQTKERKIQSTNPTMALALGLTSLSTSSVRREKRKTQKACKRERKKALKREQKKECKTYGRNEMQTTYGTFTSNLEKSKVSSNVKENATLRQHLKHIYKLEYTTIYNEFPLKQPGFYFRSNKSIF